MLSDRNLLFGILALQNDFVTRDQLVEAMNAWVIARQRSLGELLRERGALGEQEHALLEALVNRQLAKHQGDFEKSFQALPPLPPSVRAALAAVTDADWHLSLAQLDTPPDLETTTDRVKRVGVQGLRYRVLRPHARGGLGEVFVAQDTELHREVALKEIQQEHADNPDSRGRFLLEAEITGRLEHPGIVPVYGLGSYADGRPFYAMRFIKGDNLNHAIQRFQASKAAFDSVEFRQVLRRFLDVCNAVAYAHDRGILHRDLKPGNVMLGNYGETLLVDWGLAKVVGTDGNRAAADEPTLRPSVAAEVVETVAGAALGTPAYMSPEQAEGKLDALGPATDVYSLGATLYCLLTGRPPVTGDTVADVLEKVRRGEVSPPERVRADVPRPLAAVCGKAMARSPEGRYPTALLLAADVERWLADEPVSAYRDPPLARLGRWARKHRTLVTTVAATAVVALASLAAGLAVVGGLNRALGESNTKLEEALAEVEKKQEETERERAIAVAVNDFLQKDLLDQADIGNQPFLGNEVDRNPNITVAELLDRAAKSIEGKFKDQPETEATLRTTIGRAYWGLGRYDLAQPHLERAAGLRLATLGADHPSTLASKKNLGVLHHLRGNDEKAEQWFKGALGGEQAVGAGHPTLLAWKRNLAAVYRDRGEYAKAESLLLDVLRLEKEARGVGSPDDLSTEAGLAILYKYQGKYDEAEALYLEVIRQREKAQGADHPNTLVVKGNLAVLYKDLGRYPEAEEIALKVLEVREARLGPEHPDTLSSRSALGRLYRDQRKYDQAEPLLAEVARLREKVLGPEHVATLTSKFSLAVLYRAQRKYDLAEPMFLESIRQREKKLGPDHPDTLVSKYGLARLYEARRMYAKVEPLYQEVVTRREKNPGPDHPDTLSAKHDLAFLYKSQRKYAEAEPLYLDVLRRREKALGPVHPDTLTCKNNLARLYQDQGMYDRAEPLFLQTVAGRVKALGNDHADTAAAAFNLATLYKQWGKHANAEPFLRQDLAYRQARAEKDPATLVLALMGLAENLLAQGKYGEAEVPLRDSLRVEGEKFADRWTSFEARSMLGEALSRQVKYAEAEPLLVQGYEGLAKQAAKIPARLRRATLKQALERLVRLYDATGNEAEAAKWRKKLEGAMKEGAKK